jgi:hypothetical protein
MAVLAQASIMDGTDNNHGMSDQIISIIQMQPAWVTVIMEQITLDTPLTLQDIIKVIMDVQISTMTNRTATGTEAEVVGVEAGMVVAVAMGMVLVVPMNLSHSSILSMVLACHRIVTFQLVQRRMWHLRRQEMLMNSAERYASDQLQKRILLRSPPKTRMLSRSQEPRLLRTVTRRRHQQIQSKKKLLQDPRKKTMHQCQSRPSTM